MNLRPYPDRHRRALLRMRGQVRAALLVSVCAVLALALQNPYDKLPGNLALGFLVVVLGLMPTWYWARNLFTDRVPVIALHGLFYSVCFGLAGFVIPRDYLGGIKVIEGEYQQPLLMTAAALVALYAGYWAGLRVAWPPRPSFLDRDEPALNSAALTVLLPISVVASVATELAGVANVTNSLWAIRTFVFVWVVHLVLSGRFTSGQKKIATAMIPAYVIFYSGIAGGALVGLLVFSQVIGLTYVATRHRMPLVPVALALGAFFLLQPVKQEYREITWKEGSRAAIAEGMALFAELAYQHVAADSRYDFARSVDDSYTRVNHLHVTAGVLADVRDRWHGESYLPLITKWIPRVIWPWKPREDLGNRWARELGYLARNDFVTSFNLPWLPEMYLNFGYAGMVLISFLVGLLMAGVWTIFAKDVRSPMGFAAALVLCSSFFFPESNLSMDIGNLIVRAVALLALGVALTVVQPMGARQRLARGLAR